MSTDEALTAAFLFLFVASPVNAARVVLVAALLVGFDVALAVVVTLWRVGF
jgi:hypothetical protein